MPGLWRLYRAKYGAGLDGIGGTFADGRWHSRGDRVAYFGASPAIAVLERLAHTDADLLPGDLRLAHFEYPEAVSTIRVEELSALPADWIQNEAAMRGIARQWWRERSSCLLLVPSAILPEESNLLFNPQHPQAASLQLVGERPFRFDPRLL
ncbi:MAG TPA: RES domain-containing protein [Solibacterales bacterium]|nr:RES domain-containing protein [Bryobacterales bacterium]